MHVFLKDLTVFAFLLLVCTQAISQTMDWKSVGNHYAFYDYSFQDHNGNTFSFGTNWFGYSSCLIVDGDGNELFSDSTLLGDRTIVYGLVSETDSIKLLSSTGELMHLDTTRKELTVIRFAVVGTDLCLAEKINNRVLVLACDSRGNNYLINRIWLNANDFKVEGSTNFIVSGEPIFIKYDSTNDILLELYSSRNSHQLIQRNHEDSINWNHIWDADSIKINSILPHSNGYTYCAGHLQYANWRSDVPGLIICLDENGNVLWQKTTIQDTTIRKDVRTFYDIMEIYDGRIITCGTEGVVPFGPSTDALLAEIDLSGNMLWALKQYIYGEGTTARRMFLNSDRSITLVGTAGESDHGNQERLFTAQFQWVPTQTQTYLNSSQLMTIHPNPSQNYLNIELTESLPYYILNANGVIVIQGNTNGRIDISSLPSGSYFLTLSDTNFICGQFVKL